MISEVLCMRERERKRERKRKREHTKSEGAKNREIKGEKIKES